MPCASVYLLGDQSAAKEQLSAAWGYFGQRLEAEGVVWGKQFWDVDGVLPFHSRPAGFRLPLEVQAGDHVLFPTVPVVAPTLRGFLAVVDHLYDKGVHVHVVDFDGEPLSTQTDEGLDVYRGLEGALRFQQARNRERVRRCNDKRRATGKALNQHVGYGWKLVGPKGHRRRVPDLEEREFMRQLVHLREKGLSWEMIYWPLALTGQGSSIGRIRRMYTAGCRLLQEQAAMADGS